MDNTDAWSKKSVWGKGEDVVEEPIVSFVEIMSEELVSQLADDEFGASSSSTAYKDDEEMARAMQREYDREMEMASLLEQSKKTPGKHTSISVGSDKYYPTIPQSGDYGLEEDSDEEDLRELNTSQLYEKMNEVLGPFIGGLARGPNGEVISKHDPHIVSAKNVEHVMNGVIDVPSGDCYAVNVHSEGKAFNKLRTFCKNDQKRVHRLKDKEEKATIETSVDANTRLILFKWANQGLFDRIYGVIATGKESAVLSAVAKSLLPDDQYYLAIKVFKTSLVEFKNRSEYVQNDFRFKNPRGVMKIWAEKEFMNLTRMFNKNIPCPEPIKLKKNILVMGFIGSSSGLHAPQLKNVVFNDSISKQTAFGQVQDIMFRMYNQCSLVHGDLSEFNLLWNDGKVFVIDVSQAMDLSHPRVLFYLLRDIDNILSFFSRIDTHSLPSRCSLFNLITGLSMVEDDDLLCQVETFEAINRNTQLRIDKSKPADMELRKFMSELGGGNDPSTEYN